MQKIIGFGHKARQGKDTAAAYIKEKYDFMHLSFAGPLYGEVRSPRNYLIRWNIIDPCLEVWDCNKEDYETLNINQVNPGLISSIILKNGKFVITEEGDYKLCVPAMAAKDRDLLQWWGTEYRRNVCGKDYWLEKIYRVVIDSGMDIVFSDVRFPNEADFIKRLGGKVINISGRSEDELLDQNKGHDSETAMDSYEYDYYMLNSEAINDLYTEIDVFMEDIIS